LDAGGVETLRHDAEDGAHEMVAEGEVLIAEVAETGAIEGEGLD
jgi:hypothetical protein